MNHVIYSFIVSSLAGLSTMIGTFVIFLNKNSNKVLVKSLSFASGVMITVSLTDLIPSSFQLLSSTYFSVFASLLLLTSFTIGVVFSMLIDKYLPDNTNSSCNKSLYRLGIFSMIAIILHNIPEGIATFLSSSIDKNLGLSLALAISFHNIPEGISIAVPIYYATGNKKKALFYTFISAISEPLGAFLAYLFLSSFISDTLMGFLFAFIAGIMIHIATYELLPNAKEYKSYKNMVVFFLLGSLVMFLSHFLLSI